MRFQRLISLALLLAAMPAAAQTIYPTGASGVKVPGNVPLQCNAGVTSCTPATSSNPVPVTVVSGGGGGTVTIDQTTPGTTNGVSVAQLGTGTINTGNGTAGTGTLRVSVASDSTGALIANGGIASGAADSGNPVKVGGRYNSTPPTLTNGQRGDLQLNASGAVKIDGSAVTQPVSGTVTVGSITAGSNLIGKVGIDQTTPGTTNGVVATGAAATGAAVAGNPVLVGGTKGGNVAPLPLNATSGAVVVNTGQAQLATSFAGQPYVTLPWADNGGALGYASLGYVWDGSAIQVAKGDTNATVTAKGLTAGIWRYTSGTTPILSNTTTAVTIKTAAGASVRNYIDSCQLTTTAFGASVPLAIRDGAAGTVIWALTVPTAGFLQPVNILFETPLQGTANTLLEVVTTTANTSGTVTFNCQGHTGS